MRKSILISALGAGMLTSLPLHAQDTPAPAPAEPQAVAVPTQTLTPAEKEAVQSFMKKASVAAFRAMAEMTPEEIQSSSTSKTSKAALLLSKKIISIPLDPNLPAFLKQSNEKGKALTEELIKAVDSNVPAEKINEITQKLEELGKDSTKEFSAHGLSMESMQKEMQQKIQLLMGEISQKIIAENPEAAKDPKVMMKLMFTEIANKLESDSGK